MRLKPLRKTPWKVEKTINNRSGKDGRSRRGTRCSNMQSSPEPFTFFEFVTQNT